FFQDSVDANGCANVAYAADLANPGTSTINYIRQNGGSSLFANATCAAKVVKPLVLTAGSACPGPQVLDPYGDAKGSLLIQPEGGNVDTSDIGSVTFAAPDATHLKITMKVKNLSAQPPDGTLSEIFDVYWTYQGKTYFVEANENPPGLVVYSDGTAEEGRNNATGSPAGAFNTGPDGTIVWTLDRKDVGNPPNGAALTGESAESHAGFRALGTGVSYRATIDRAPDFGSGTTYVVGACTPAIGGIDGTANPPSNGTGTNQGGSGTAGNGSGGSQTSARGTGASLAATGTGPMLPAAGLLVLVLAGLARRRWTHPRTDGVRR
ncbi:MAG: hypothetical protein M3Z02_06245, partial [Actinomycetota bacterium]|nr:hypothetical protein [Actinomycetota bacterium]